MQTDILTLDCTIRDGGYINRWQFTDDFVRDLYLVLENCGIDYMEVGFRNKPEIYNNGLCGKWRYCGEEDIINVIQKTKNNKLRIAVMADYKNSDISLFLDKEDSVIDMVRVAFHKEDLNDALTFCKQLKDKGYIVCANAMATIYYSNEEIKELCELGVKYGIDYIYIADSYGCMNPFQVLGLLNKFHDNLSFINSPSLGFHSHNNQQNAFMNVYSCISNKVTIIDSTVYGMGRGAGNFPTEIFLSFLQINSPSKTYKLLPVLLFIEKYILKHQKNLWGYSIPMLISSHFKCHPNYVSKMNDYNITDIKSIWKIIKEIVDHDQQKVFDLNFFNKLVKSSTKL